jgi:hypothetical protein
MDRNNHYERAFASYLRGRGVGVVAVDECRRSRLDGSPVKSADFLVVGPGPAKLVIDVKGRRFPGGTASKPRPVWPCWSTEQDVRGLRQWADGFGNDFRGVLAFVYDVAPPYKISADAPDGFSFEGRDYLIKGIDALAYAATMTPRSRRWGTVHLPAPAYRALCRPFSYFLNPGDEIRNH